MTTNVDSPVETAHHRTVDAASSFPSMGYQPSLDGLRALSVGVVLLYHAGFSWMLGGFFGVEVFFVVSGFLITSLLLDEADRNGQVSFRQFWLRRARRLFPALYAVLLAVFSRVNIAGFRVAFLTFANLGLVSYPERSLLAGPLYQGYGLGFRLRNENLTFNSLQIRFTYYPNLPNNAAALRYAFEGVPVLRFRDFDINSPQVTLFQ